MRYMVYLGDESPTKWPNRNSQQGHDSTYCTGSGRVDMDLTWFGSFELGFEVWSGFRNVGCKNNLDPEAGRVSGQHSPAVATILVSDSMQETPTLEA